MSDLHARAQATGELMAVAASTAVLWHPRTHLRWGLLGTGILAGFAFLEQSAYRHGHFPTLTAVLRYWLGIAPSRPDRTVRAAVAAGAVAGGLVALAVHLARVPDDEPTGDL